MSKLLDKLKKTVYWERYNKQLFLTKLEKDAWEGEGIELFIRCKEIIQEFEEKNKEVSDEELYRIGEGFFKELYELNSKWYSRNSKLNFHDISGSHNFQCPQCQEKHNLDSWYNKEGTILYLDRDFEKSNCPFLNKYNEGIIYDYREKEIETVIKDSVDREIAYEIRKRQQTDIKRKKQRAIIQKRTKEKGLRTIGVGDNLEQAGIELLKEFTCDNCEQFFTEKDIQEKNYQLTYGVCYVNYVEHGCQAENWLCKAKHQKCVEKLRQKTHKKI